MKSNFNNLASFIIKMLILTTGLFFSESKAQNITTIAGTGVGAFYGDSGLAINAGVTPLGVCVDYLHNIYIADFGNNRIRKIDTAGIITTIAGNGIAGFSGDNGPAVDAKIMPFGVCADTFGNVYFADGGRRIRKVNIPTGVITTIAGDSIAGFSGDNGPAINAKLSGPVSLCMDLLGNIYVADQGNNRIRKISLTGTITTVAGNGINGFSGDSGLAVDMKLSSPDGVWVDKFGNLYISDPGNNRIWKDTAGIMTVIAGNGVAGHLNGSVLATSAELNSPNGVCVDDSGNLYIPIVLNNKVAKMVVATHTLILSTDFELAPFLPTVKVYPNPFISQLIVDVGDEIATVFLTNGLGQVVLQTNGTSKLILKPDVPPGTYFLKVVCGKNISVSTILQKLN